MVKHIVFLKFEDNSLSNKKEIREKILSMDGKIDELLSLEVGINFSKEERAYDIALIAEFKTKEDLNIYATHPIHLEIIEYLKSKKLISRVVDFVA